MPTFEFKSPDGKTYSVEGPEGATPEQAFAVLNQQLGNNSEVTAGGLAKSAGVGVVQGLAGLAGAPGDLAGLAAKGYDYLRGGNVADTIAPVTKALGSENILKKIEGYTGELPKPQNRAEEFAQTAGSFLPLAATGPGGIVRRVATNVLAPAAGSEIAKEATKGTEYEPYAPIVGAVVGGAIGSRAGRALASNQPTIDNAAAQVKTAASNTYKGQTSRTVATPITQAELDTIAADFKTTLNQQGIRPSNAGGIHAAIDEIRTPATKGAPDVNDLVAARLSIKNQFGSQDASRAGATILLPKIDAAIEKLSPGTMAELKRADKDWAAIKAVEALDKRTAAADLRAATEHSGMNVGNKIRQKVASYLLSNEARYLSDANRAALEKISRGTYTQNALRLASNLLGGGGGLGSTLLGVGGATAGYHSGHPELALAPIAGFGLRGLSNRLTQGQARKAAADILSRSPTVSRTPSIKAALKPSENQFANALLRALMAR